MLRYQQEKTEKRRQKTKAGVGMHLENEGLSHGLKNSPLDCFSPRLRRGRPFESYLPIYQKSRHPFG